MPCTIPESVINDTIAFHGHKCPGLAIGIRAAELAMQQLGDPNEITMVAISETDMCGVDAIQFLTGCTYGKGNFLHRDYGKMAFSFYDRNTGKGIRALLNNDSGNKLFSNYRTLVNKEADGTLQDFLSGENRYAMLERLYPDFSKQYRAKIETDFNKRYEILKHMSGDGCEEKK